MNGLTVVLSLFYVLGMIAFYAYNAICLMFLAKKTGTPNGWMAWIPILNVYLMCKVGGKSGAWIFLFLIPVVNIVIFVILWAAISERCGKPGWLGILMLISPINLIIMGILAFSKSPAVPIATPQMRPAAPVGPPPPPPSVPGPTGGRRFCSQCGAEAGPADRFCPGCGAQV